MGSNASVNLDSASGCMGTGYSLGSLELTGSNPLSASSWTKYNNGPIFKAAFGNYAVRIQRPNIYIITNVELSNSRVTMDSSLRELPGVYPCQ
jgi:hypothetical protein